MIPSTYSGTVFQEFFCVYFFNKEGYKIAYFDTYPENDGTAFNGAWSVYPYFSSGNIVISDIDRGMFIIKKNQTLSIDDEDFKTSFSLIPNPTSSSAKVKASQNQMINSIEIYIHTIIIIFQPLKLMDTF